MKFIKSPFFIGPAFILFLILLFQNCAQQFVADPGSNPPNTSQCVPSSTQTCPGLKPNIIVIMTDDQDEMGTLDVMTHVKALLLDKGIRFTNSFVANPLCCPSRATFLTGQLTHNNGVWFNYWGPDPTKILGGYGALLPTEQSTLPVWLQKAGYTTALIGKYLNGIGLDAPPTHIPAGWSRWFGAVDPTSHSFYNYTINDQGTLRNFGSAAEDYQADVLSAKAIEFINAQADASAPTIFSLTATKCKTAPTIPTIYRSLPS